MLTQLTQISHLCNQELQPLIAGVCVRETNTFGQGLNVQTRADGQQTLTPLH